MPVQAPEWLTRRGGHLRLLPDAQSWSVVFDSQPQYRLTPLPVTGKFGCEIMQTINGKRLEKGCTFSSADEAITGGLEDLRQALGW